MPISQSLFTGMDMDTSYSLRDSKKYFKLLNGDLIIDEELGTGTISNSNGNVVSFRVPQAITDPTTKSIGNSQDHIIIGAKSVGDYVVLCTTSYNNQSPGIGAGNIGAIWAFKYNNSTGFVDGKLADDYLDPANHIVFYDRLNFSTDNPVKIVGNSENDDTTKIYITDDYNNLRQLNILEDGLINESLDHIEIIENISFSQPTARLVDGGTLKPGAVQYAFQMFSYGGSETRFSTTTPLLNISEESYGENDTSGFIGTELVESPVSSGKAAVITVPDIDIDFDFIRLVRIFYNTEYGTPDITIIAEIGISDTSEIIFTDDGDITLGSFTHQEFASMGGVLFSAKDITTANNRLIAANITESYYNPTFDARAYRFSSGGSPIAKIVSAANPLTYYLITPTGVWNYYINNVWDSTGTDWDIPKDFDAVNPDQETYKYQSNGTTLGATGLNVSYKFNLQQIKIDSSVMTNKTTTANDGDIPIEANTMRNHYVESGLQEWSNLDNGYIDDDGYLNYASEINSAYMVGYRRDEKYRFGLVSFDTKGRSSFVEWIGDIKMPKVNDTDGATTYTDTSTGSPVAKTDFGLTTCSINSAEDTFHSTYANILGVDFVLSDSPDDAVSYQIVRVPITSDDKSILASGLMTPVQNNSSDSAPLNKTFSSPGAMLLHPGNKLADNQYIFSNSIASRFGTTTATTDYSYSDKLMNFWSPEISFYKDSVSSSSTITVTGKIRSIHHNEIIEEDTPWALFYKAGHITNVTQASSGIETVKMINRETSQGRTIPGVSEVIGPDTYEYQHYFEQHYESSGSKHAYAFAGSGLVLKTDDSIKTMMTTAGFTQSTDKFADAEVAYGVIKADNPSQYNGDTITARKTNKYIKASALKQLTGSFPDTTVVFGGDTYIGMFEHTKVFHDNNHEDITMDKNEGGSSLTVNKSCQNVVVFPVETSVNLDWRNDRSYTRLTGNRHMLKEDKGSHELSGAIFNQETDSYLVNYSYLKDNNIVLFTEVPTFFDRLTTNLTHRLMASEAKYDGEMSDSWLRFKPNNILDVNGTSGQINGIEAISEHLYYFQDNSIGMTRIDERALVNDTEGVSLVLGTGDIFSKPRTISTHEGTVQRSSIVKGRDAIYFYDTVNQSISVISSKGAIDITRLKGVRSYIKSNVSSSLLSGASIAHGYGVYSGFNPNTGMVYFTFKNPFVTEKPNFTIGYSEIINEFVSLHSFTPLFYISDKDRFITTEDSDHDSGWLHAGYANKCSYYGSVYDTVLTSIVTDHPSVTKVFDTIEYTHDADEVVGYAPVLSDTFTHIRCYNNFLDTGKLAFTPRFRFRTWRGNLPRYIDPVNSKRKRLMGKYLKTDLTFTNTGNKDLFLQPLITHWRPTVFMPT